MIDTIALWLGYIILLLSALSIIAGLIFYLVNKYSQFNVMFKALYYHVLSQRKEFEEVRSEVDLRVGRKWWAKHKGDWYLWELVKIDKKTNNSKEGTK